MPDLDDQLRDLVRVSEPERQPLAADVLRTRARHVRHARRVRVVVPSIVVLVALVVAGVVLSRGRDSALDVINRPGPPTTGVQQATEVQRAVDRLTVILEVRRALAIEALWTADAVDAPGAPRSPALVAARTGTDAQVEKLRSMVEDDGALRAQPSWRATQTRIDQLPVIRTSSDQGQSEALEIVDQYGLTLGELDGLSRDVRPSVGSAQQPAFDRYGAVAAQTDAQATTWWLATLAVRVGFFPSNLPTALRPEPNELGLGAGCGADAAAAGPDCGIYQSIAEGFARSGNPPPDPVADATYLERVQRVLDLGRGGNDLSSISGDQLRADALAHLEARFNLERHLLEQI